MKVELLSSNQLFRFLQSTLPFYPFRLFVHVLSGKYLGLLCRLPDFVKEESEVYLDRDKKSLNEVAVEALRSSGFRNVYWVSKLHAKVIIIGDFEYLIIGSANLSSRSFSNYEVVVLFREPDSEIIQELESILLSRAVQNRSLAL